jgi:hypothetical protein
VCFKWFFLVLYTCSTGTAVLLLFSLSLSLTLSFLLVLNEKLSTDLGGPCVLLSRTLFSSWVSLARSILQEVSFLLSELSLLRYGFNSNCFLS